MRGFRPSLLGPAALALLCAVAILHPGVVGLLPAAPRVILGVALITSGLVLSGLGRSRHRTGTDHGLRTESGRSRRLRRRVPAILTRSETRR